MTHSCNEREVGGKRFVRLATAENPNTDALWYATVKRLHLEDLKQQRSKFLDTQKWPAQYP